ncbi:MAG: enolase C-terminal domain-like protein [Candidatus Woesearchaeota archaeon]
MNIEKIKLYSAKIKRRYPFRTSRAIQHHVDGVFVEIVTDNRIIGTGESSPRPHINEETLDGTFEELQVISQELAGKIPRTALDILHSNNYGPSARTGIEIALLDAICQAKDIPICDYVDSFRARQQMSYCGLINSNIVNEALVKKARLYKKDGFDIVRVKVGELDFEKDLERVKMLHEIWQGKPAIWLDVNQSWSMPDAIRYFNELEPYDIIMVEQPLPANAYEDHAELRKHTSIPIMIDEGVQTPDDLDKVIETECADAVNLKFLKLGSIFVTAAEVERARQAGLIAYCGATTITDVCAQYMRHLEASINGLTYFSSGIPRSSCFVENPTIPQLTFNPRIPLAQRPTQPGLGIKLNHRIFDKYVIERWET